MSNFAQIFDEVDTQCTSRGPKILKEALRKEKGHFLLKKCSEAFVDKAPDETIEKTYVGIFNGEKTANALSAHVVSMYANVIDNFVKQKDSGKMLRKTLLSETPHVAHAYQIR